MNNIAYILVLIWLAYEGFGSTILGLFHAKKSTGEYGVVSVLIGMSLLMLLLALLFIP